MLKKLLLIVTFLVLTGLAGFHVLAPVILEKVLISRMSAAGLEQPRVKVLKLGLSEIHLADLSIAEPEMSIDLLSVFFDPAELVRGRVDQVLISGLDLQLDAGTGFPAVQDRTGSNDQKNFPPALFFSCLEVNSAAVQVQARGKSITLPFSARIQAEQSGQAGLDGRVDVLGLPVALQGKALFNRTELEVQLTAQAGSKGLSLKSALDAARDTQPGFTALADLSFRAGHKGPGSGKITIQARAEGLDFPLVSSGLEQGHFSASADLNGSFQVEQARAGLDLSGFRHKTLFLDNLSVQLSENLSRVRSSVSVTSPVKAWLELEGGNTGIEQIMAGAESFQGSYQWQTSLTADPGFFDLPAQSGPLSGSAVELRGRGELEAEVKPGRETNDAGWGLALDGEITSPGGLNLEIPGPGVKVQDLNFFLPFELMAEPDLIRAVFLEQAWIRASRILTARDGDELDLSGLSIQAAQGRPLLKLKKLSRGRWSMQCFLESASPLLVSGPSARARADDFAVHGHLAGDGSADPTGRLTARFGLSEIRAGSPEISLHGVSISLPVILGTGQNENPGTFAVKQIRYKDLKLPGPSGRATVLDERLNIRGTWSPWSGAELDFSAWAFLNEKSLPQVRFEGSSNWIPAPKEEILQSFPLQPGDLALKGHFQLNLDLRLMDMGLKPVVNIEMKDMGLSSKEMDLEVTGLSGSAEVNSFMPLTSSGHSRIKVESLRLGGLELEKGHVLFRLEPQGRIFVEKSVWHLPEGGRLAAASSRVDLPEKSADLEFFLEDIDMIRLVSRLSRGKVAGSGLVFGRIPVYYKNDRVVLGDGYLYSVPGKGTLSIRDEKWLNTLLLYVREAMSGHEYLSVVTRRLEEALRDFEYDYLTLDLVPLEKDTRARIELRGRGIQGDPPQEVGSLVIKVNDLGEIINRVLHLQLGRDETIRQTLDDLFPGQNVQ